MLFCGKSLLNFYNMHTHTTCIFHLQFSFLCCSSTGEVVWLWQTRACEFPYGDVTRPHTASTEVPDGPVVIVDRLSRGLVCMF